MLIISFVVRAGEGGRGWSQVASGDDERTDTWFGDCLLFQWLDGGQMPLSRCHGARAVLALEIKISGDRALDNSPTHVRLVVGG